METEQSSNDERCSMVSGSTRNIEMSPDQYGGLLLFQNRHFQSHITASFSSEGTTGTQVSPVVPLQLGILSQQSSADDTTSEMSEPLIPLVKSGAKIPQSLANDTCQESQSIEESQSLLPQLPMWTSKHGGTFTECKIGEKSSLMMTSFVPEEVQDHSQWELTRSQRATTLTQSSTISSKQQGETTSADKRDDSDQLEKITARLDRLVASLDKVSRKQMMVMEATVTQCISNLQDSLHSRLKKHTSRISTGVVKKLLQTTQTGLIKLSEQHKTEKKQLLMQSGTQFSSQKFAMPSARSIHGNQNALDDLGKRQKKVFSLLKRQKLLMDQFKASRLSSDVACPLDRFQLSQSQQPTVCLTETMEEDLNVNEPTRKSVESSKERMKTLQRISLSQTLTEATIAPQLFGKSSLSYSVANNVSDVDNRVMKENYKECKSGNGFEIELNRKNNTVKINIDSGLEQGSLVQGNVVTENKPDKNGRAVMINTTDPIDNESEQAKIHLKKNIDGNKAEVDVTEKVGNEKSDKVIENESTADEVTTIPDTQNIFTQETYTSGRDLFIDRDEDYKASRKPHEAGETELDGDKEQACASFQTNPDREHTKHKDNEMSVGLDQSSVILTEVEIIRKSDTEQYTAKSRKDYEDIEDLTESTKSRISANDLSGDQKSYIACFEAQVGEKVTGSVVLNVQSKRHLDNNDDVNVSKRKKMQSQEEIEQTDKNTSSSTPINDSKGSEKKKPHSEMLWLNMLHTDSKKNNTKKEMKPNYSVERQRNEVYTATKLGPDIQATLPRENVDKNPTNNTSHKSWTEQANASKRIVSLNPNDNLQDEDQNNRDWSNQNEVSSKQKTATICENVEDIVHTRKLLKGKSFDDTHNDVVDKTASKSMGHQNSVIQSGLLSPTVERMEVTVCSPTNATVAEDTCYNGSPMTLLQHSDDETLPENTTYNANTLSNSDKYVTSKECQAYNESSMSYSQPFYKEKTYMNKNSTDLCTHKTNEVKADKKLRKCPDHSEYDKGCARDTVSDSIDCVIQQSRQYASNTNSAFQEANDGWLSNSVEHVLHIDARGENVPSNQTVQRLQNSEPEWGSSQVVNSQHMTRPLIVSGRESLPPSSSKTLPSLKELVQQGIVTPGKQVLSCKVKGKVHTASLTPLGKIRTKEGLIFGTASQWLSTLSEGAIVKKRKAYEMIHYKARSLLSICTPVSPESQDKGFNLPVQPYNKSSYSIPKLPLSSLDRVLINSNQNTGNLPSNTIQETEALPIRRKLEGSVTDQGIQVDEKVLSQQSRTFTEDEKRLNNLLSTSVVRLLTEHDLVPCDDLPRNFWTADFSEVKLCIDFWNMINSW